VYLGFTIPSRLWLVRFCFGARFAYGLNGDFV